MPLAEPQSGLFDDPDKKQFIVDRDTLCAVLGVVPSMLQKYLAQGMPKYARGQYDLGECVQWLVNYFKQKQPGGGQVNEDKQRLIQAQTQRHELETARLRRELIDASQAARALNSIASTVAQNLDGLASRTAGTLADMDDPAQIQVYLFDESRQTRNHIAAAVEALAVDIDLSGDHQSPAE